MAPTLDPSADYTADGTGADERPAAEKIGDYVSVLDYIAATEHADMKAGTSTYDASADYQAAIDANKGGTIVHPAGFTINAAGMALSGATYDGTSILIEGTLLMTECAGIGEGNWDPGVSPAYNAITLHDVENVTISVPGVIDGNRANQPEWEQIYCLYLRGARKISIPILKVREIRGDAIGITSKTNVDPLEPGDNSEDISIGAIEAINAAYDGRNALSLISAYRVVVGQVLSIKVGEVVNGVREPGGVDIEPDGAWHDVEDVVIGPVVVDTQGSTGVAALGKSLSENDANEDWNVRGVTFSSFRVLMDGGHGGPAFSCCKDLDVSGHVRQTARGIAMSFDRINGLRARIQAEGVAIGAVFGANGYVRDFDVDLRVDDHNDIACVVYGLNKGRLRLATRGPQGGGSYGLGLAHTPESGARAITLTDVVFDVDIPCVVGWLSGAILVLNDGGGGSIAFGEGTHVKGSMTGYDGTAVPEIQFINRAIPSVRVQGRHFRAAAPTAGLWLQGEEILNTMPVAGGPPGWVCTTGGTAGSSAVFKPMADTLLETSTTYNPPNLADGAGTTTTVSLTGAAVGDFAQAAFSNALANILVTAWVSASNTVSVRFQNESGGAIDLASGTLRVRVAKA